MKGLELKFGVSRSGLSVLRVSGKLPSSCLGFRSGPYCKELYFACRNFCCALAVEKFTAEGQTADQWSSEVCRYVFAEACQPEARRLGARSQRWKKAASTCRRNTVRLLSVCMVSASRAGCTGS